MKIALRPKEGPSRPCKLPYEGATYVEPEGACPACRAEPWKLQGGTPERGHDSYTSAAQCTACKVIVGQLVVTLPTLFGLEEDERVLGGPWKVY